MANRAYICYMNALYISGFEPLARNGGGLHICAAPGGICSALVLAPFRASDIFNTHNTKNPFKEGI